MLHTGIVACTTSVSLRTNPFELLEGIVLRTKTSMELAWVADQGNGLFRSVSINGIISNYADVPQTFASYGDGGPATSAAFHYAWAVWTDTLNQFLNETDLGFSVRRIDRVTRIISSYVGTTSSYGPTRGLGGCHFSDDDDYKQGDYGPAVLANLNG
eukprot:gene32899-40612_t